LDDVLTLTPTGIFDPYKLTVTLPLETRLTIQETATPPGVIVIVGADVVRVNLEFVGFVGLALPFKVVPLSGFAVPTGTFMFNPITLFNGRLNILSNLRLFGFTLNLMVSGFCALGLALNLTIGPVFVFLLRK